MKPYIKYKDTLYKRVNIRIDPTVEFNDILFTLNSLGFKDCEANAEQVTFALLELINNSLRAHREKNITHSIHLIFEALDDCLHIIVQDWGGGFDPQQLPYELFQDPSSIDTNNAIFQRYRENHNYLRFGMGIYVVKKTFETFNLYFIDEKENRVNWESGKTAGTLVELTIGHNNG
jgi:light-regulated signal transduction histidine kinase (bacteriophytochrome)